MLRYDSGQASQKWTRTDLAIVAGAVVLLLCIWGAVSWKNYRGDESRRLLSRTGAQLDEARKEIASLKSELKEADAQLAEANSRIIALASVAQLARRCPSV